MTKILALDPVHEDGLALLKARPDVKLVHLPHPTDDDIANQIHDADILLLRGRHLRPEHWRDAANLRLVTRHGVGCDNVDFDLMGKKGVTVAVTADANYVSVAEHAFALMLAACRNLIVADTAARGNDWSRRENLGAREVKGASVLVVGYGRIGQAFAERAAAFGAELLIHDPYLTTDAKLPVGARRVNSLAEGVAEADIISLHLPRTTETEGLFGAALLGQCREGAILINTGRGGVVDEAALLDALDEGRPGLYATDVLASEPPALDDPLLARSDVIITPHSAAMTAQGAQHMAIGAARNALDFLDGTLSRRMIAFAPDEAKDAPLSREGTQDDNRVPQEG